MASLKPEDMKYFFDLTADQVKQYANDQFMKDQFAKLAEENKKDAEKKDRENKDFYDAIIMAAEYREYQDFLFNLERLHETLQEEIEELENEIARSAREAKTQQVESSHTASPEQQRELAVIAQAQQQVDKAISLVNTINNLTQQHAISSAATQQFLQQWTQQTWVPQVAQLATNLVTQLANPVAQLPQLQAAPQLTTAANLAFSQTAEEIQSTFTARKSLGDVLKHVPGLAERKQEIYEHQREIGEDSVSAEKTAQAGFTKVSSVLNEFMLVVKMQNFYRMISKLGEMHNLKSPWGNLQQALRFANSHEGLLHQFHEQTNALYEKAMLTRSAHDSDLLYQKSMCTKELSGILQSLHALSPQIPQHHSINERMGELIALPKHTIAKPK